MLELFFCFGRNLELLSPEYSRISDKGKNLYCLCVRNILFEKREPIIYTWRRIRRLVTENEFLCETEFKLTSVSLLFIYFLLIFYVYSLFFAHRCFFIARRIL